jgi:hypothetical protein
LAPYRLPISLGCLLLSAGNALQVITMAAVDISSAFDAGNIEVVDASDATKIVQLKVLGQPKLPSPCRPSML